MTRNSWSPSDFSFSLDFLSESWDKIFKTRKQGNRSNQDFLFCFFALCQTAMAETMEVGLINQLQTRTERLVERSRTDSHLIRHWHVSTLFFISSLFILFLIWRPTGLLLTDSTFTCFYMTSERDLDGRHIFQLKSPRSQLQMTFLIHSFGWGSIYEVGGLRWKASEV
jgi:hypothetical protein